MPANLLRPRTKFGLAFSRSLLNILTSCHNCQARTNRRLGRHFRFAQSAARNIEHVMIGPPPRHGAVFVRDLREHSTPLDRNQKSRILYLAEVGGARPSLAWKPGRSRCSTHGGIALLSGTFDIVHLIELALRVWRAMKRRRSQPLTEIDTVLMRSKGVIVWWWTS